MSHDELLLCFDNLGNPINPQIRSVVHTKPYRIWHGVTAIWVFNSKKEILCTKRSKMNEGNPGKWQTYVGGHVKSDQTFIDAAVADENAVEQRQALPRRRQCRENRQVPE